MNDRFLETVSTVTSPFVIGGLLLVAAVLILLGCLGVRTRAEMAEPIRAISGIFGVMAGAIALTNIYIAGSTVEPHVYRFAQPCVAEQLLKRETRVTYWDLGRAIRSCSE